ncbi:hypothetical protein [Alteromonas sp. a30]|uniref:hypothetical protein n=1 Tax=Alteromonas sp. a30 TaxID=2730917 RepID=UPI0022812F7D|nr:hypothetical protein [Alteromonas sp. a30]MCY7295017.1 hypothetical protein [Alteromonas sp. a30]
MISIHSPISGTSSLSVRASNILGWMPGSMQWLEQAINDSHLTYNFSSETALLNSIAEGLFSTNLIPVADSGVVASADFLMSMSESELQTLSLALPQKNTQAFEQLGVDKKAITAWHNLQAETVLDTLQVSHNALFLTMSLDDIGQLSQLNQTITNNAYPDFVYLEAARFALKAACSASAFCHFVEFACITLNYLVSKNQAKKITPNISNKFNELYQDMLSKAVKNLNCPQLTSNQGTLQIPALLQHWGQQNAAIGFRDMATAIVNWVRHSEPQALFDDIGNDAQVKAFQNSLIAFTCFLKMEKLTLSQDSKYWFAKLSNPNFDHQTCEVMLDENGCVSVLRFEQIIASNTQATTNTLTST